MLEPDDLEQIGRELQEHRARCIALACMKRYGVLIDTEAIAHRIAAEVHKTAQKLEEESNQLELLPPAEKGDDRD